jgi:predicted Zn-dependent protease
MESANAHRIKDAMNRFTLRVLTAAVLTVTPVIAGAQSMLRDAETEAVLRDAINPILRAANLEPKSVNIYLIGDPSLNAFVTGGQNIFFHSGLLLEADDINQVLGVAAHETGHITGGHNISRDEGAKAATGITLLSLLLGAGAIAAGAGDAGAAILMGGQTAALGKFLSFTRTQEASSDQAGAKFLDKAGISGKGIVAFFEKLQNEEIRYFAGEKQDGYWRSHPLTTDRIASLNSQVKTSQVYNKPVDAALNYRFLRAKAKLAGFTYDAQRTLNAYPETDKSEFGHYARAYAYHKSADVDQARAEMEALLAKQPNDPFYLELKGQILLESGKPLEALPALRKAVQFAPNQPMIATLLGHALIATEEPANMKEARGVLERASAQDRENPFTWYQLGVVYDRAGDAPRAALASAEQHSLSGDARQALQSAKFASAGLKRGTPEWLRAEDIAAIAEDILAKDKKNRRRQPKQGLAKQG